MNNDVYRATIYRPNIGCVILDIIHEIHARTKAAVIKSTSNSISVRCDTLEDALFVDNIVNRNRAKYGEELEITHETSYHVYTYRFRYKHSDRSNYTEGYSDIFEMTSLPECVARKVYSANALVHPEALIDAIKKVIFSGPCTIILWNDGTKTIVRCGPDDEFDKEKGIAMCILKKMFGSSHQMSKWMKEQIGEEEEEEQGFKLPPFFFADDKKIDL